MAKTSKADERPAQHRTRYRLKIFSLGGPCDGVDLDKALALAGSLEDAEILRKMLADRKP